MGDTKEIVVVTGSSGCLGQHIVKLLQEKDDKVGEIRLIDRKAYQNKLGHAENKPMKQYIADVRDMKSLREAFSGADCVIHAAQIIDVRLFNNLKEMETTNIDGTKNVIEACIKENVPRLVYTSTTLSICGSEHIFYGTESTTPAPTTFMIGKYGEIMNRSEQLVVDASGRDLENGNKLRTATLRPTPIYGEQDKNFFYYILKFTKNNFGYYPRVRSLDERMQICYAGNAAWAHIKAKDRLAVDESISGEAFFITDDTPIIDIHDHLRTYVESRGYKVSSYIFPYWLAWLFFSLLVLIINLINCFVKWHVNVISVSQLNYMCSTFFYNRAKATLRLDYQPIYTYEEAEENSMRYYSKVPL